MGEGILRFLDEVVGHFGEKHDFIPQSNAKTPYGRSGSSLAGEPQCPPALGLGFGSCGRKVSPSSRLQLAQGCWGCSLLLCVPRLQVQHEHGAQGSTVHFHSLLSAGSTHGPDSCNHDRGLCRVGNCNPGEYLAKYCFEPVILCCKPLSPTPTKT